VAAVSANVAHIMDSVDRQIINGLQGGFPVSEYPFADAAKKLGLEESVLIKRVEKMLGDGTLSRFGPLYNIEKAGGSYSLCAMAVPDAEIEHTAEIINQYPEIAHNYERDHYYNLWFVVATESPEQITSLLADIEEKTGFPIMNLPKQEEFYVGLHFDV